MGILEQQYQATLRGHIQQYWQPPDVKNWDPNIFALVSITIASDGQIVSQVIDQGSITWLTICPSLAMVMLTSANILGSQFLTSGGCQYCCMWPLSVA